MPHGGIRASAMFCRILPHKDVSRAITESRPVLSARTVYGSRSLVLPKCGIYHSSLTSGSGKITL
jgi:hypothetical protein